MLSQVATQRGSRLALLSLFLLKEECHQLHPLLFFNGDSGAHFVCNGSSKTLTKSQMHVAAGAGQRGFWLKTKLGEDTSDV